MLIHTFSNNNYPTIHAYNNLIGLEAGLISQWAGLAARGLSASGRSLAATLPVSKANINYQGKPELGVASNLECPFTE